MRRYFCTQVNLLFLVKEGNGAVAETSALARVLAACHGNGETNPDPCPFFYRITGCLGIKDP